MRILYITLLMILNTYAASISIPLNDSQGKLEPANDLIYNGQRIDSAYAQKLKESGVDLSKLDPRISHLFLNKRLSTEQEADLKNKSVFKFTGLKSSPTEIFRFFGLDKDNKKVVLTASLDNHTNIIRALLLRLIGYDINRPSLLKTTQINFDTEKEKESFLEKLSEQTLSSRTRWIQTQDKTSVTLRHIILDKAELKNVNLYLPVMTSSRQTQRRVFRSLLAIYTITDFSEAVNKIDWSVGSVFNGYLSLTHPYASAFRNTSEDDLKWVLEKINKLTRSDIESVVKKSQYPIEVEELVVEKLISRIESLSKKLRIQTNLIANKYITNSYVVDGKLTPIDFEDSAINYSNKDIPSPYRFRELFRLFGTQAVYSGLSSLLDQGIESVVPGIYNEDASRDIQNQINEYRQENPNGNGNLPVKVFSSPTAFGRVFLNRNIVFGQVLDSVAPIQLVNSVGAEVNLGLQGKLTGITNKIIPNLGINASLIRTYSHVRAMPDLKTASKQKISNILVPVLLKKLGKIIKDEYACSISELPFVEEKEISGELFYTIKYDQKDPKFKQLALNLREKLIKEGIPSNKILLLKFDRDSLCTTDIQETRSKSIDQFLKSFAENETFVISDSIRLTGLASVPIPIMNNMNLTLGTDASKALIRSVFLKKVDDTIQVTIQEQKDQSLNITESLSFYIRLVKNSNQFLKSNQKAKFYKVKIKEDNEEKQKKALRVIRDLFVRNDKTELYENYKGEDIEHDVQVRLNTFRVLWFKKDKFKMGHDLSVIIPNRGTQNFPLNKRTRTFYQQLDYKRKGSDFHSFANDILGFFSNIVTLGQASNDPGKTFLGNSTKEYYSTEAETTKGYSTQTTTRVEFIRSGWSKRSKRIYKYFDEVDEMFSSFGKYNPIDRSILHGSKKLKSYDIRSTIILYPSAIARIQDKILNSSRTMQTRILNYMSDNSGDGRVRRKSRIVLELLSQMSKSFINVKDKVKAINKLYKQLFSKFNRAKVLELIGEENFFATTRIMGFLEEHHEGVLQYSADTIGSYDENIGTGKLDQIANEFGITSFQLRALNYSPGMQ